MPHGRPDWYNITPLVKVHASEDVNEGAVRLGTISVYDRRGNVVFQDTFQNGLGYWDETEVIGSGSVTWSVGNGFLSPCAVRLEVEEGVDNYAYVQTDVGLPTAGSLGIEWVFQPFDTPGGLSFGLNFSHADRYLSSGLDVSFSDNELIIYDAGVPRIIESDLTSIVARGDKVSLKWAVDITEERYLRLLLNSLAWSLVDYSLSSEDNPISPSCILSATVGGSASGSGGMKLFGCILTVNED